MTLKGLVAVSPVKCFLAVSRNVSITRCCVGVKGEGYPCAQICGRSPPGVAARAFRARPCARFRDGIAPRNALLAARPEDSWPTGGCVTSPASGDFSPVASFPERQQRHCVEQRERKSVEIVASLARHASTGEVWQNVDLPRDPWKQLRGSTCSGPSSRRTARGSRRRRPWPD